MGCEHLDEYYEVYLLGAISEGACLDIREHIDKHCDYCLAHLREAAQSVYLLCLTTRAARPDPKLKTHLLRRYRGK